MNRSEDPFFASTAQATRDDFAALVQREMSKSQVTAMPPVIGTLQGFDLLEQPLVASLATSPGQVLSARTTVPLSRSMIGRSVVVVFEGGDPLRPIILWVIEARALVEEEPATERAMAIRTDGERYLITAEREIVLQCGEASITLTRAGKVIIKGNYILSRSTGCNKLKGAAIDIN
jgi:hypothetical protein